MKISLATVISLGLSVSFAEAAPEMVYVGRVGLYDQAGGNEFTRNDLYQSSLLSGLTNSGWLHGFSPRYNGGFGNSGQAAWVARASDGMTTRIGLFTGAEFTRTGNYQYSSSAALTESGWLHGRSERYNGANTYLGDAVWVARASDGETSRIGLFSGAEFTRNDNYQLSAVSNLTASGWLRGHSNRYNGGAAQVGQATWVARASDGVTVRIGFFSGPEYIRNDNYQYSIAHQLTESGWLSGVSERYAGSASLGVVAWVARASDGATTRIGLFSGPEFTRTDNYQSSGTSHLTESGWVGGASTRYNGGTQIGQAAWVARASDGLTTRVGLVSGEFTRADNLQHSAIGTLRESGWASGLSQRYNGGATNLGQAAWVARASDGATTRIGLFSGAEFTRSNNYQFTEVVGTSNGGWLQGYSERYNGGSINLGQATWVARASDGTTARIGLFSGAEFTRNDAHQLSTVTGLTQAGWVQGTSDRYDGGSTLLGQAAWVARASDGSTTRIGFSGPEFARNDNFQYTGVDQLTESGWLRGSSIRYNGGSTSLGQAAWVARASDGTTTRIGLFSGPEFTRNDDFQVNIAQGLTESGWLRGSARRYDGADQVGEAAWLAAAANGATTRVGLTDAVHTALSGLQYSTVTGLTEEGLAWGNSRRYHGDATQDGQTAWIYDLTSDTQITLELSVRPSDGSAFSNVDGITSFGLAYGTYTHYAGETSLGNRAFLWSTDLGVQTLNESISGGIAQYGWEEFLSIAFTNAGGFVAGYGLPLGDPTGSQGVYLLQVPEPTTAALLVFGATFLMGRRRRFR
jgi:hypothetical protein